MKRNGKRNEPGAYGDKTVVHRLSGILGKCSPTHFSPMHFISMSEMATASTTKYMGSMFQS